MTDSMKLFSKAATQGIIFNEPVAFELGSPGRRAYALPELDVPDIDIETLLPPNEIRGEIERFPELSELDVVRHFTRLSQWNFSIDTNFYPLGSCTMKYNPKINDQLSRLPRFALHHPYAPQKVSQGCLQLLHELQESLKEISGMKHVCLQPAAGAHGELAGMLMVHAYHSARGDQRKKVLLPDSAHGTNPASSALCGYDVVHIPSNKEGLIDIEALNSLTDEHTAAIMLTNPNTLGKFEKNILEITNIIHQKGGLVYCDGANLNALIGIAKMGDMGIDVLHFNLHKTFSTPHGGGGPGAGPIGINEKLEPYLPIPIVEQTQNGYRLNDDRPKSIGKMKAFYGNFGILLRAYCYILTMGCNGLKKASESAVLNANYIQAELVDTYHQKYPGPCLHECVFDDKYLNEYGVKTIDIAKALIDQGYHPPTVYFPLIVKGALMIEPTETESKETLDQFIFAMKNIAKEAETKPENLHQTPLKTKVCRLDETRAARNPILRWKPEI